jgi:hypothetical protein
MMMMMMMMMMMLMMMPVLRRKILWPWIQVIMSVTHPVGPSLCTTKSSRIHHSVLIPRFSSPGGPGASHVPPRGHPAVGRRQER